MARSIEFIPEEKIARAMHVFWSKGFAAASLSDLTGAMQLNKSSLYNSIGDKHTLFRECLKAYGRLVEKEYIGAAEQGDNAIQKLDSIIDYIEAISTERDNSCLGIKSSFEVATEDKEIRALIKAGNDKTIALLQSLIKEAQVNGQINTERDADTMAHFIFNSFSGLRQSYIIYGNRKLVKKMAAELKAFLRV